MVQSEAIRMHMLDGATRQLFADTSASIRVADGHDFAFERSIKLRIVVEHAVPFVNVVEQLEDLQELAMLADRRLVSRGLRLDIK